jgi:hypothetical protein
MNEKFKLLALEAQMGTADFDAGSYYVATPDRMQKLCELIVRECAGKVDFILREKSNGGGTMGDEIREHFGVEP